MEIKDVRTLALVDDGETAKIVSEIFEGTSGLVGKNGEIRQDFVQDFNKILGKL